MQNKNTKPSLRSRVPEFCSPFRKHLPYHAGLRNKVIFFAFFSASEGEHEAGVPSSLFECLYPPWSQAPYARFGFVFARSKVMAEKLRSRAENGEETL